jgi:hypothetical protein
LARGAGRWDLPARASDFGNVIEDPIRILQNVEIPESQHQTLEIACSKRIMLGLLAVLRSINFEDQHRRIAEKIGNVFPARDLATKFEIVELPIARTCPKSDLGGGLPPSQPSCNAGESWKG